MFELLKERKRNLENTKDIANIPWNEYDSWWWRFGYTLLLGLKVS
jgi:hypothetical protein